MGCIWVRFLCLSSLLPSLVTYLLDLPFFPRGPRPSAFGLSWFLCIGFTRAFSFLAFLSFPLFFFSTRTSRLAPTARTLLDDLGHATFNFAVVVAPLFLVLHACPMVLDFAKQGRNIFGGVSKVGINNFPNFFSWLCVFLLVFYVWLLPSRVYSFAPRRTFIVSSRVARTGRMDYPLKQRGV